MMKVFFSLGFILLFFGEIFGKEEDERKLDVIVFVHGTLGVKNKGHIRLKLSKAKRTKDDREAYPEVNIAHEKIGLRRIEPVDCVESIDSALLFTSSLMEMYMKFYDEQNECEKKRIYYAYGWSGALSESARCKAGKSMYKQLEKLNKELRSQGYIPSFKIITHSHGGNVALHMLNSGNKKTSFFIDALVMFGVPIHRITRELIIKNSDKSHSLFKDIFNLYSYYDWVQVSDIFSPSGLKNFGTDRIFWNNKQKCNSEHHKNINFYDVHFVVSEEGVDQKVSHIRPFVITKGYPYVVYILPFLDFFFCNKKKFSKSLALSLDINQDNINYIFNNSCKNILSCSVCAKDIHRYFMNIKDCYIKNKGILAKAFNYCCTMLM